MEVYTENEQVVDVLSPKPCDNSIGLKTLVDCIGVRAKSYCNSSINKYLFSYGQSWLCVAPRRSDYDYYYSGSLLECASMFADLCNQCITYNFNLI